jgi:hypothetical protein
MTQTKTATESVAIKDGILFVSTAPTGGEPEVAGDTAYAEIVAETIKLAALTTEPRVKVILAKACIEVHKHPGGTVSVCYEQGAPIVKSLQRMVRKLARQTSSKASHHTTNERAEPRKQPTSAELEQQLATWPHPTGTPVRYWPGAREGEPRRSSTQGSSTILGGHTAGVFIAGAGFVALSHVEVDMPKSAFPLPLEHADARTPV